MRHALLALLFLGAACVFGEETLYTSNALGMPLQRIAAWQRGDTPWVLSVTPGATGEVRRLYQDGTESRRWVVEKTDSGSTEREFVGDELRALRARDAAGNLLREETWARGAMTGKDLYTWTAGRLTRMRALAADGTELFTEVYHYAANGSLREVVRTGQAAAVTRSSFVVGPAGLSEERVAGARGDFVTRYDTRGRVESRQESRDGVLVSREDFQYAKDSDTLVSSTLRLAPEDTTVDRVYDAGRLATETTTTKGVVVLTDAWLRDGQGRVTEKTRRGPSGLETWQYALDDAGNVKREQYMVRGAIVKITLYGEGSLREEDLYQDGEIALKVFYNGDTRLREEVYAGGVLQKSRDIP